MGKKNASTIENRVYLFKDLAAAWLSANPGALLADREAALKALADIGFACCVMADTGDREAAEVGRLIREG